jgi:hypothetical protein
VGLDVAENIRASGGGRKMFLTCPYIEQAITPTMRLLVRMLRYFNRQIGIVGLMRCFAN